jgi:hypothetical protein
MQRYWLRISLGALAVFAIGMFGISMYRKGVEKVATLTSSADPINIPLAMMPFQLDGSRLGRIEKVQIRRDAPKRISGVGLVVQLAEATAAEAVPEACVLTIAHQVDDHGPQFHCANPADSLADSLTRFGDVRFEPGAVVRHFYLPGHVIEEWRAGRSELMSANGHDHATQAARRAARTVITVDSDSGDTLFELRADSSGARLRIRGDSGEVNIRATAAGAEFTVREDTGGRK